MVLVKYAWVSDVISAIERVSERFEYNVTFSHHMAGKAMSFTLSVDDAHGPGARRGPSGRATHNACWHVYGMVFDEILRNQPGARIVSNGLTVTKDGGNWRDYNIGSLINPIMASDACGCKEWLTSHQYPPLKISGDMLPLSRCDVPMGVERVDMVELKPRRLEDEVM